MPLNMIYLGVQLLLLSHMAQSFILVTANMEDIKKIARKFFSESLANKIAEFVTDATSQVINKEVSGENNQFIENNENISEDNEKLNKARQRDAIDKITDDFVRDQAMPQNTDDEKTPDHKPSEKGTAQNIQWENEIDNFSIEKNVAETRQETPEEEHAKLEHRQKQMVSHDGREPSAYREPTRKPTRNPKKKPFKRLVRRPNTDAVREPVQDKFIEPTRETVSETIRETVQEITPPEPAPNREFVKRPKGLRKLKKRLHRPVIIADRDTDIYHNVQKPTSVEFINAIKHFTNKNLMNEESETTSTTEANEPQGGEKDLPLAIQGIINKKHRFSTIKPIDSTVLNDDLIAFKQHVNRFRLTAVDSKEEQHYEMTTEKERTDFDQYDNIMNNKAQFVATSGPVVLPKVPMLRPWWEQEMPK